VKFGTIDPYCEVTFESMSGLKSVKLIFGLSTVMHNKSYKYLTKVTTYFLCFTNYHSDHTKRTKTFDDSKNPEWNQDLEFPKPTGNTCKVQVKIHHEESLGKDK